MLITDCISSALKSGGDVDFAKAGARNSANSVLLKLTEKFAEKVTVRLENDENLKKLLGSPAFVPFLFSTWMNANAWPKTLEAVERIFSGGHGDDDDGKTRVSLQG